MIVKLKRTLRRDLTHPSPTPNMNISWQWINSNRITALARTADKATVVGWVCGGWIIFNDQIFALDSAQCCYFFNSHELDRGVPSILIMYSHNYIFSIGEARISPPDKTHCLRWGSNPQPLDLESSTLARSDCAPLESLVLNYGWYHKYDN